MNRPPRFSASGGVFAVVAAVAMLAIPARADAQSASSHEVTFARDVAPILQRSCQNCHRPGGGAPMSLLTFEEVRPWVRAIKQRTANRSMPPWFIEKNVGIQKFRDDISLSDAELATIGKWADNGAPRGNPADMPPPRVFVEANTWSIGEPDLIVSSPTTLVKAVAADWHGELGETPSGLNEPRYVKAIEVREFRPREGKIAYANATLHHMQVSARAPEGAAIPRERVPVETAPQVAQSEAAVADRGDLLSYLWEVGQNAMIYPDDFGVLLPKGTVFYFPNVHTHSYGQDVEVQVQVGIRLQPKGYTPKYRGGLITLADNLVELDFPAGQDNIRYDAYVTIQRNAKLLTFEPHMHALGKRMCVEATYPDGGRQTLNCAKFIYTWMKQYIYDDDAAPLLPAGTILHVTAWYDNSAGNKANIDPRNWKGLGQRSIDDMFFNNSKVLYLSDSQFKEEVDARNEKLKKTPNTHQN